LQIIEYELKQYMMRVPFRLAYTTHRQRQVPDPLATGVHKTSHFVQIRIPACFGCGPLALADSLMTRGHTKTGDILFGKLDFLPRLQILKHIKALVDDMRPRDGPNLCQDSLCPDQRRLPFYHDTQSTVHPEHHSQPSDRPASDVPPDILPSAASYTA
jgi:hypothetical protein